MSLRNEIAKLYARYVFHEEGPFDPLETQVKFNVPDPPKGIAVRCELANPGGVRSYWVDKQNSGRGLLVYLHGGAFYFGPVKEHWQYIAAICRRTQMAGLMVDYSLAPQSVYPQPLDEIARVIETLEPDDNWAILGDSSGAAFALSVVRRLHRMNMPTPAKLVLMSPWLDITLKNPAIKLTEKDDVMMTVERLSNAARAFTGEADAADPDISPMFAQCDGLPSMLLQIGTADLLLWDCRRYYIKCLEAGADIIYEEYPRAFHDFMMLGFLPEARRALDSQADFITSN
jgi:acetyl esterase/lipase